MQARLVGKGLHGNLAGANVLRAQQGLVYNLTSIIASMNTYERQSKFSLARGGCMVRKKREKEILKGRHGRGPPDSNQLQISKPIEKKQGNMLVKEH